MESAFSFQYDFVVHPNGCIDASSIPNPFPRLQWRHPNAVVVFSNRRDEELVRSRSNSPVIRFKMYRAELSSNDTINCQRSRHAPGPIQSRRPDLNPGKAIN